ncbi:MAG: ribosomal-processing cysteine protease Prp [Bacilli bacterium]|nr:ribosomal-processing cysteine protease Prp [Bacilli bacterium]
MIKVTYKKENDVIAKLTIKGHANYDEYGKDIVCASVSTMFITSINIILSFDEKAILFSASNNAFIENIKKDEITNKVLNNLIEELLELESKYKENINIKEE